MSNSVQGVPYTLTINSKGWCTYAKAYRVYVQVYVSLVLCVSNLVRCTSKVRFQKAYRCTPTHELCLIISQ